MQSLPYPILKENFGREQRRQLLEAILAETEIRRLRISSLQPQEVTAELLHLWQNPRLCRHFHLSLQSGSDPVLRRMGRQYRVSDYEKTIDLIRSEMNEAAITTDIIVGFPGETEIEFRESYDFCSRMKFARLHIFPFSVREDTRAAQMPEQVDNVLKKQRSAEMLVGGVCSRTLTATSQSDSRYF
jgi:threonylcarbamoyladenosine tRNA methylthiotransferase MtaB